MPSRCCVPNCSNRKRSFSFPKDLKQRLKWRVSIRRADPKTKSLWKPSISSRVCEDHFAESDFVRTLMGERKRLKLSAIPHLKLQDAGTTLRSHRYKKRTESLRDLTTDNSMTTTEIDQEDNLHIASEIEVGDSPETGRDEEVATTSCSLVDSGTQCRSLTPSTARYSHKNFVDNKIAMNYYTSFDDHEHFMYFFNILGPASRHLKFYKCLPQPEDQLFLTLIKLRQGKDDMELSFFFKISQSSVSEIVNLWINFMYFQLKELDLWPSGEIVEEHMPQNFRRLFPKTKLILDATESPIQRPQNADAQSATYSTYKNKNTVKTMIGCTPRGVVTYVSDSYGGSTSDRQIIERSPLMTDYPLRSKDSIMADRGIMVQDLFSSRDVQVNTPHTLKGKHQLDAKTLVFDRRIAAKRIHVERVIGLGKTFKILKKDLNSSKLALAHRITFVCFMISNFRRCIVGPLA